MAASWASCEAHARAALFLRALQASSPPPTVLGWDDVADDRREDDLWCRGEAAAARQLLAEMEGAAAADEARLLRRPARATRATQWGVWGEGSREGSRQAWPGLAWHGMAWHGPAGCWILRPATWLLLLPAPQGLQQQMIHAAACDLAPTCPDTARDWILGTFRRLLHLPLPPADDGPAPPPCPRGWRWWLAALEATSRALGGAAAPALQLLGEALPGVGTDVVARHACAGLLTALLQQQAVVAEAAVDVVRGTVAAHARGPVVPGKQPPGRIATAAPQQLRGVVRCPGACFKYYVLPAPLHWSQLSQGVRDAGEAGDAAAAASVLLLAQLALDAAAYKQLLDSCLFVDAGAAGARARGGTAV